MNGAELTLQAEQEGKTGFVVRRPLHNVGGQDGIDVLLEVLLLQLDTDGVTYL